MNRTLADTLEKEYAVLLKQIEDREPPFGQWVIGLWPPLPVLEEEWGLKELKGAFFFVLERLLKEGRIVLAVPGSVNEDDVLYVSREQGGWSDVWNVAIDDQLKYIKSRFPQNAATVHDTLIADFFYGVDFPIVGWVDPETQKIISS